MSSHNLKLELADLAGSVVGQASRGGRLTVLIYHRVRPQSDDLFPFIVDAARFEMQMRLLRERFTPLPLFEAIERLQADALPRRAVCVTFDDGYADNVEVALPILLRYGVPATFFISTGFLDGGSMWNDVVIETLRALPGPKVDLSSIGLGLRPHASIQERRATVEETLRSIKYLPVNERADAVRRVRQLCEHDVAHSAIMMTRGQVRELHRAGMGIGGHTVSHPILTRLDDEAARAEIHNGRRELESIIGAPVESFAYPNGKPGQDYQWREVEIVRALGFRCAFSTAWGAVSAQSDLLQLPRFTPWDFDPARFLWRLLRNYDAAEVSTVARPQTVP
jgi:peptidoglycan/xylan/chitin deacetylase (PgdA/CDA1 family)